MDSVREWMHKNMKQENKEEILCAVMEAWEQICPGWELFCISLPVGDMQERKKIMEHAASTAVKSTRG